MNGQITVTTAGTPVQGPNAGGRVFAIKAHPDNTDTVWVGGTSAGAASSSGFPLNPGEGVAVQVGNVNQLWFDADVNGSKVCYLRLE